MDFYERQEHNQDQIQKDLAVQEDLQKTRELERGSGSEKSKKKEPVSGEVRPKATDFLTAFKEINFGQDWGYFVAIVLSIVVDIIGLVPYLGAFMGFFFSIIFFVIQFVSGQLENRALVKGFIFCFTCFLESIGGVLWLNLLPLFTFAAVLIYWLELSQRRASRKNNA